ncbi:unnamed protein product [Staurois parvus]|uniref:Uncharacterized protein n=1 Tax=Staurois parvus TaxID=386267 RepID=A0ABN9FD04_9NEOB|nr:unnamed protein product [Staurois parvus]
MRPLCPRLHSNHTQKAYERYQGHLMGPPTDPRALRQCPSFQMVSPPLVLLFLFGKNSKKNLLILP